MRRDTADPTAETPYTGYDDPDSSPFLLDRIRRNLVDTSENSLMDRVILVPDGGENILLSYRELKKNPVINRPGIVIIWEAGTASALDDGRVGGGRDVGSANAFSSLLDGRSLTFEIRSGKIYDRETGTEWNSRGSCP